MVWIRTRLRINSLLISSRSKTEFETILSSYHKYLSCLFHLTSFYDLFDAFSVPCPPEDWSDKAAWWVAGMQARSTLHDRSGDIFKACLLDQALHKVQLEEMNTVLILQSTCLLRVSSQWAHLLSVTQTFFLASKNLDKLILKSQWRSKGNQPKVHWIFRSLVLRLRTFWDCHRKLGQVKIFTFKNTR